MQIKAVTFDVGGTLIEPWPSVGHVYAEVAARHGSQTLSAEEINSRFKAAWRARKEFQHSFATWGELVDEVFAGLLPTPPTRTFFPELYQRFAEPDVWRIFDDVAPTLEALASRGFRLGVISNWDERLRGLLQRLKLDHYFEMFTISYEVGSSKPSRDIFDHAAAKLGLPGTQLLHVGDSFEMDVEGAKAAGFHALQIHRTATVAANSTIRRLTDLPSIIAT